MEKIDPLIKCVDTWPGGIPPEKMKIYKDFISEGQITKPYVLVNKKTHTTVIEYLAIAPHEWILEEMKARL